VARELCRISLKKQASINGQYLIAPDSSPLRASTVDVPAVCADPSWPARREATIQTEAWTEALRVVAGRAAPSPALSDQAGGSWRRKIERERHVRLRVGFPGTSKHVPLH
jgi:hypothetical protein